MFYALCSMKIIYMNNAKIKKIAIEAAQEAGKMLLKEFENFDRTKSELKSQLEIVTKADLKSEKMIIKKVKNSFPDHKILAEESGKQKGSADYLWIIDPIDGTTNFSMHNPLWSISIGVAYQDEIILGVVYAPFMDEMFIAESGEGAKKNSPRQGGASKKIQVSNITEGKVLNTFCHGSSKAALKKAIKYYNYQKLHGFDCRQLGSAAIELSYVASGRIESIVIPGVNAWDVAAGVLLVREAGGRVTDSDGSEWTLRSKDIVASNGKVHDQLLKVLKRK